MAQLRLRNYEHPLLSFEHNMFNLGLHSAGRYVGFNQMVKTVGMTFNLTHTESISYVNPNEEVVGPIGVVLTPQGTIIQETGPVGTFTVDGNLGNSSRRFDLIYLEHNQIEINNGQAGVYKIKKGNIGSDIKPTLPDPGKNTSIGYVEIPAEEAISIDNCRWFKSPSPDSGDGDDARRKEVNQFEKFQGQSVSGTTYLSPTKTDGQDGFWDVKSDGNTFILSPASATSINHIRIMDVMPKNGNRMYLRTNSKLEVLSHISQITTVDFDNGYRPLFVPPQYLPTVDISLPQIARPTLVAPSTQTWEFQFVLVGDRWVLVNIGGRGYGIDVTAPKMGIYSDNLSQIIDGAIYGKPGEKGVYTPPTVPPYAILLVGEIPLGDIIGTGANFNIYFADDMGNPITLPVADYHVSGGLEGSVGVWAVVRGSKTATGFTINVRDTTNENKQAWFGYSIMRKS